VLTCINGVLSHPQSPLCDCGEQQTMELEHTVDSCPLTKLDGGLLSPHEADDDAISWLKMTATKEFRNNNNNNNNNCPINSRMS